MAITYYYPFDRTNNNFTLVSTGAVPASGYDLTEFDNDTRGTPRVARWSDFERIDTAGFDAFVQVFGYDNPTTGSIGWCNWSSSNQSGHVNKYYQHDGSTSRGYFVVLEYGGTYSGEVHDSHVITTSPRRAFGVSSWVGTRPALVYFPDYEKNGGHDTLTINNTSTSWDSNNERFASIDGNTLLSHNGTTWVITDNGTSSTASHEGESVPYYVDPVSSDLTWQNGSTVTISGGSAVGDPHVRTFGGQKYTL